MIQHRQASEQVFAGDSEMAMLMRSRDWSQTPLGSVETWSQSLKTTLNILFNAYCPMLLVWGHDRILFYNDAYSLVLSESDRIPLGQPINGSKNEAWSSVYSEVEQVFSTGQSLQRENQLFPTNRDSNTEAPVYTWCYSPLWDEVGQVGGVFATGYRVISKETADSLRQSEARLSAVAANLPNGAVFIVDRDLRYLLAEGKALEGAGMTSGDLVGKTLREALDSNLATIYEPHFRQALGGQPFSWEHCSHDRYYISHGTPLRNDYGEVDAVLAVSYDITDRKRAELNAEFLANISQSLVGTTHVDEIVQTVGEQLNRYLNTSICAFVEINEGADEAVIHYDWHQEDVPSLAGVYALPEFASNEFQQTAKAGQAIVVRDIVADPRIAEPQRFAALKIGSFINIPLIRDNEWKFTFGVYHRSPYNWRTDEIELMRELAARIWNRIERIRAEAALRESEAKYRTLFNSMDEGYFLADVIFDKDDRPVDIFYLEANPAVLRLSGLNLAGRRLREIDPNYESHWWETFGRVAQTGVGERQELYAQPLKSWYNFYVFKVGDANSRRVAAVFQNVTDRKKVEIERERFLAVGSDLQVITGINGYFQWVSPTFERTLGWTQDEMISRPWTDFVHPDDVRASVSESASLFSGNKTVEFENRYLHKDGSYRWFLWNAQPYPEEQVIYGTAVDITERKQAELEIRKFVSLADNSAEFIGMCDMNFVPFYVNAAGKQLVGLDDTRQYKETLVRDFFFPEDQDFIVNEFFPRVLHEGRAEVEIRFRHFKTGEALWMIYNVFYIRGENDQPIGLATVSRNITDRKHFEQALMESETIARTRAEELTALMEITPAAIWIGRDPQCHQMTANQAAYQLMRVEPGAVTTATPEDGTYPLPFKMCRNGQEILPQDLPMQKAIRTRQAVTDELEFVFEDGTVQFIYGKTVPLHDSAGEIRGAVAAFVDISDRKRIEEALRTSEERLRFAVEGAALGTWEYDLASSQIVWSERSKIMFGVPLDASVDYEMFINAIHPDDRDRIHAAVERAIAEQEIYDVEMRSVWANGSIHWIRSIGRARYDRNGLPISMIGVALDITARKQAEEDLRESERRFRRLVESNMFGVAFGDFTGGIHYVNDYFLNMVGYTREEIETENIQWTDIIPTEFLTLDEKAMAELRTRGVATPFEKEYIRKDGSRVPIIIGSALLQEPYDQQQEIIAFYIDLTEQKQAEAERERLLQQAQAAREEAETANRIKDEFLAVLSHELRSPLNPILGWSKLLQTRQFDEQGTRRALQTIERNAKLQTQLIEDLLDVSRILRGKMALNISPVNLVTVIESALETVRLAAEAKRIQIQTVFTSDNAQTLGDSARLQQIVWNLLSNAVKFTPDEGQVEVCLNQIGSYAQIQVKDTGKGISSDFLPYVFDYFRQEDGKTTRKFGGLGLGLAIARHLSELHGGTVHAESAGEGHGATFAVRLPLMTNATESGEKISTITQSIDLSQLKILVVDDDEDMRNLVQVILAQQGVQVRVAASAAEALMLLDQQLPDILISDIGMPEMDGYMLMQQIRDRLPDRGGLVSAIALTAYAGEYDQQQALKAGFQKHIPKPVEPEALVNAISELISIKKHTGISSS